MVAKEKILKQVSEDLQQPLDLVEKVIGWSYKQANQATKIYNEIEISGLGTSMVSFSKVRKRIKQLESMENTLTRTQKNPQRLEIVKEVIKQLKERWEK